MYSKIICFICIQFAIFNGAYSQYLNRIQPLAESLLPNLVGNQLNYLPYDLPYEILPNLYPGAVQPNIQLPNVIQPLPNVQPVSNVLTGLPCAPTIIQDSTVANNLANALQLLVVSNLLSNTLPQAVDRVPAYPPIEYISPSSGRYNYFY